MKTESQIRVEIHQLKYKLRETPYEKHQELIHQISELTDLLINSKKVK